MSKMVSSYISEFVMLLPALLLAFKNSWEISKDVLVKNGKIIYIERNYKLLEEIIGKTLSDINHSRILYDPPPRILEIK